MSKSAVAYRADIDGLRALAVTIVILFHFEFAWFPGGFVGVDVFFVISGFLITSLIARQIAENRFSLIDFYERRFRRIYPNLLIVLAATTVLGWFALIMQTYQFFGRTLVWAALSASNFAFLGGKGYFDPDNLTKPLLHTWSLGVEEQFYLVFPWLLILAAKRGYNTKWLIGAVVTLSLLLSIGAARADWAPSYFLLPTRFWELGIGALIAILPTSDHLSSLQRSILGLGGLLAITWATLRLSESDPFPGYVALAPTLGAAAIIWANGGLTGRLLSFLPFVWIGRLSFALYLWHWPLISIAAGIGLPPTDMTTRIIITAVMLALSVAGYFLWEQPIRQRCLLPDRRAFFATLSVCVTLLVGAGIWVFTAKGFPERLPREIAELYINTKDGSRLVMKSCPQDKTKPYSCQVGAKEPKSISFFIIGDSHSEAVAAEIGDIAARYGLRGLFFGKSACKLFAEPVVKSTLDCVPQHELVLKSYNEYKPQLVIAIARWPDFLKGATDGKEIPDRYRATYDVFDKTLSFFASSTVVTAPSIPTYDQNIGEFAGRSWFRARLGLRVPPVPVEPLSDYRRRQADVWELLDAEKLKHSNLKVVDPAAVLCPDGVCLSMVDNKPLYFDTNHLSHAGAQLYAPLFEPFFASLAETARTVKSPSLPPLRH